MQDVQELMAWLNGQDYTPITKSDIKKAFKRFMKWVKTSSLEREVQFPPEVSWIRAELKPNGQRKTEILTDDEIKAMIEEASSLRGKALIAVLAEWADLKKGWGFSPYRAGPLKIRRDVRLGWDDGQSLKRLFFSQGESKLAEALSGCFFERNSRNKRKFRVKNSNLPYTGRPERPSKCRSSRLRDIKAVGFPARRP